MVSRHQVKCLTCGEILVVRVQVSASMSPDDPTSAMAFVAPCPHCGVLLHARLVSTPGQQAMVALLSDDVSQVDLDPEAVAPTLTVATDVPVHVDLVRGSSDQVALTPFIRLGFALKEDAKRRLASRVGSITQRHEHRFPVLRRSVDAFNRLRLDESARLILGPEASDQSLSAIPPAVLLGFEFKQFFEPLGAASVVEAGRIELYELAHSAAKRNPAALLAENKAMWERGLERHRTDVLNKAVTLLGDFDPLIAALAAEELLLAGAHDEFRVMRDDFDILKTRLLDTFELGSITVAYLSRVMNIALRGEANSYPGEPAHLTLAKALRAKAEVREGWLVEMPHAASMFKPVQRKWRNLIGHHLVRNDLARGRLVLNNGAEEQYIVFLTTYLAAVRLSHYLAEATLVLTRLDETVDLAIA